MVEKNIVGYVCWIFCSHNLCWLIIEKQTMKTIWKKEHSKQNNTNKNKFIYQQVHKNETSQNIMNILI